MRGIYFISDDHVYDLTVAFLNSVRGFNPFVSLCLVPFSQDCCRIKALASEYDFNVCEDREKFEICDRISRTFHSRVHGEYRKLALWEGPFDEFIYIDVDTIVLSNVDELFDLLSDYDLLTSHSNMQEIERFVWKNRPTSYLNNDQICFAANTGFILSRKNTLSLAGALRLLDLGKQLTVYMELECAEQPFLNLLIVRSDIRYSSIYIVSVVSGRTDLPLEVWSGHFLEVAHDWRSFVSTDHGILLVHWAGEWKLGKHLASEIWQYFRNIRPHLMLADSHLSGD